MSCAFEVRLHQMGQCMQELSKQAEYLQELFKVCLEDYNLSKEQDSNMANLQIANYERNIIPNVIRKRHKSHNRKGEMNNIEMNSSMNNSININSQEMGDSLFSCGQTGYEMQSEVINEERGDYFDPNSPYMGIKRQGPEVMNCKYEEREEEESCNNNNLRKRLIAPKKAEPIFVTFTIEEKERIVYDWLELGISKCERKWGVNHGILGNFVRDQQLFRSAREKAIFMDIQRERIDCLLHRQNKNIVYGHAEIAVKRYSKTHPFGLVDLCDLAYDRGIAVIASRFHLNLFEFEFLIKDLSASQWKRMEDNRWNCIPPADLSDLEIVKLSQLEGVDYASKKTGKSTDAIKRIRRMCKDYIHDGGGGDPEHEASFLKNTQDNLNTLKKHRNYQVPQKTYDDELITF